MRRTEGTATQDNLAPRTRGVLHTFARPRDTGNALSVHDQALGQSEFFNRDILHRGAAEVSGGCAPASPFAGGRLDIASPELRRAIEIIVTWNAKVFGGLMERLTQRMRRRQVRHGNRPPYSVKFACASLLIFAFLEIGQNVIPTPAGATLRLPAVKVFGLAAHIDHAVD